MIDKLEDALNGCYNGLYGEVVDKDIYHLRDVEDIVSVNDPLYIHEKGHKKRFNFIPDIFFDLGANVGVFTRYAHSLYPKALIISVEPNEDNAAVFKRFTPKSNNIIFLNKAIGNGVMWHHKNAVNGSGESYVSEGLGYPKDQMAKNKNVELSSVETIMLDELINTYYRNGMRSILKLDIEGGENAIWEHKPSMDALKKIDYITGEIHFYALHGGTWQSVQDNTREALKSLEETHDCELDNVNFWATKK